MTPNGEESAPRAHTRQVGILDARHRLLALEVENRKLTKLLAESMLDQAAPKELRKKMAARAAKREAVAHLRNVLQMSERRACTLVAVDRNNLTWPLVPGGLRETVLERSFRHTEEGVQRGADRDAASPDRIVDASRQFDPDCLP